MKTNLFKIITIPSLFFTFFVSLISCNNFQNESTNLDNNDDKIDDQESNNTNKILIAYFSRSGENYNVGNVDKGNTEIIADIIKEEINAETFKIERVTPYPTNYSETLEEVRNEAVTRPELASTIDITSYTHIFLGYPIWNADLPMPVYTFLESNDWSSKVVIPFNTHEGSGQASTISTLRSKCDGADVLNGLAIRGSETRNNYEGTKEIVLNWLSSMDFLNNEDDISINDFNNVSVNFASNPNNQEKEIAFTYMKMQQALIDKDMNTLEEIIDDSKTFTHMSGLTQTKDEFLKEVSDGTLNYFESKLTEVEISIISNLATIRGKNTLTANAYGSYGTWTLNINATFKGINNNRILVNN